ncbi:MAG: radical SAM protein [Sandaracinaceae bacterium]
MAEERVAHTARVYTNETCNQNCAFCDRRAPRERPEFVARGAVEARIDAADAETLVLTGGEPTLRRDLVALVRRARARATVVELETNAALIDLGRARALAEAGLDTARVHLPAWGEALDAITRDPGGHEATRRGVEALAAAGLRVEASAPIARANAETLPRLPAQLRALPIAALRVGVPTDAPDRASLLPLPEAARVLERVADAARRVDLSLTLDPHASLPPCLLAHPARHAHLFSLTPGGRTRPGFAQRAACGGCQVADRCPGVPEGSELGQVSVDQALRPIDADRVRRRLSLISTPEAQVARELYQDEIMRAPGAPAQRVRTVRIVFACNQSCEFCFVSTHLPRAPDADVERAIAEAASGGAAIALSGGEPTLHPRLTRFVELAKAEGAPLVEVQTNATRVDDALAATLREAGVDIMHVSLHAMEAARSDAITGAPGTFTQTLEGLDAIQRAGLRLRLSYVFHRANVDAFPGYVEAVAARWPGAEINVSFVAPSTDMVPRTTALIPRYGEVMPGLADGVRAAARLGVRLSGFDSMCGVPLCLAPEDLLDAFAIAEVPEGYGDGETSHPDPCQGCALRPRCFGVRRGYVELYGADELRPR